VTVRREQLEPGDRIILYTDGIVEARNDQGEEFGLQRFTDYIVRHNADNLPVHETLRQLVHAVVEQHAGELVDDATVLLAEWLDPDQDCLLP
jgi:serine phosphatase RsbU (regulator of sigma subunit)